jgi:hypothetical protein
LDRAARGADRRLVEVNKRLILFLVATAAALAQSPFGFGLKAGVPLNDALSTPSGGAIDYFQSTHRFTIGPFAEFRLPSGFSVEIDALYRSYSFREALPQAQSVSTNAWEFPVLEKKLAGWADPTLYRRRRRIEPLIGKRRRRTQPQQ